MRSLAVSPDGSFLAAGVNYPKTVSLWNLKTGERLHRWPVASETLREVRLGEDGSSVMIALENGSLRCWDLVRRGERSIPQRQPEETVDPAVIAAQPPVVPEQVAYSRDGESKAIVRLSPGKQIALAGGGFGIDPLSRASTIVWLDRDTGHVRREIEIPQSRVSRLAFSPDGQQIAAGGVSLVYPPARGFIRIFRLRDRRELQTIEFPGGTTALTFTPDGKQIVAGLQDTSIVIWNVGPMESALQQP